jgi:hypothetical protein
MIGRDISLRLGSIRHHTANCLGEDVLTALHKSMSFQHTNCADTEPPRADYSRFQHENRSQII